MSGYGKMDSQWDGAGTQEEPRNRRERPRMSDINRAVDKAEEKEYISGTSFGNQPGIYDEVSESFDTYAPPAADRSKPLVSPGYLPDSLYLSETLPADKNTPDSLQVLRFEIYDLLSRYSGDLGKTIKYTLMQEVERLFQEYTNS